MEMIVELIVLLPFIAYFMMVVVGGELYAYKIMEV